MPHWKQVHNSIMESIYHNWLHTKDPDTLHKLLHTYDLQDQSEVDEIDLEHYLEGIGD